MPKSHKKVNVRRGSTRGTVFREVARIRLEDAEVLLDRRRHGGAVYLAGYAVECAFKFAITRRRGEPYLPAEMEIHKLDDLLDKSGLKTSMDKDEQTSAAYAEIADYWQPARRYSAAIVSHHDAQRLCKMVRQLYSWIIEHAP